MQKITTVLVILFISRKSIIRTTTPAGGYLPVSALVKTVSYLGIPSP